jgi:hypothetical protein
MRAATPRRLAQRTTRCHIWSSHGAEACLARHGDLSKGPSRRTRPADWTCWVRLAKIVRFGHLPNVSPARPHRPEAQDAALSRLKHGFESRRGRHSTREWNERVECPERTHKSRESRGTLPDVPFARSWLRHATLAQPPLPLGPTLQLG